MEFKVTGQISPEFLSGFLQRSQQEFAMNLNGNLLRILPRFLPEIPKNPSTFFFKDRKNSHYFFFGIRSMPCRQKSCIILYLNLDYFHKRAKPNSQSENVFETMRKT